MVKEIIEKGVKKDAKSPKYVWNRWGIFKENPYKPNICL